MTAPAWRWFGALRHGEAWAAQEAARARVLDGGDGEVLLGTHPAVITLGRSADRANVLIDDRAREARGVELVVTERGGDVTLHDPGQLMIYAIVRLRRGVIWHLETIAGAIAEVCRACGVDGAAWRREPAGVWLDGAKLAACGLHVRRGVAAHGFAFNVATPPAAWQVIRPCGLATPVVSLAEACAARGAPPPPPLEHLATQLGPMLAARLR